MKRWYHRNNKALLLSSDPKFQTPYYERYQYYLITKPTNWPYRPQTATLPGIVVGERSRIIPKEIDRLRLTWFLIRAIPHPIHHIILVLVPFFHNHILRLVDLDRRAWPRGGVGGGGGHFRRHVATDCIDEFVFQVVFDVDKEVGCCGTGRGFGFVDFSLGVFNFCDVAIVVFAPDFGGEVVDVDPVVA